MLKDNCGENGRTRTRWQDKGSFTHWRTGENDKGGADNGTQAIDSKKRTQEVKLKMQATDETDFKIKQELLRTWRVEHMLVANLLEI